MSPSPLSCFRDWQFILALLAGPVVWAGLVVLVGDVPSSVKLTTLLFFQIVILYPVLEEFAFRGTVQSFLLSRAPGAVRRCGLSVANVVTSVLFAAAHLLYQPALWALATFFPSLLFGYFRERYGRVIPGAILHSWYNFGFLLFVVG